MVSFSIFVAALTALGASQLSVVRAMPQPASPFEPRTTDCTKTIMLMGGIMIGPTRTIYESTTTKTNFVDCTGCSLTVSENWGIAGGWGVKQTATVTKPIKVQTTWACETGTGPN